MIELSGSRSVAGDVAGPAARTTGIERTFGEDEIIVSKTDPAGKITYVNHVFEKISGYNEAEVIGKPHSLIRHPKMPRIVFKLLWDRISAGEEVFAFVLNRCKNGDEYWVFAHVTPTIQNGAIVGHHSSRRTPNRAALPRIAEIYAALLAEEKRHPRKADGLVASGRALDETLGNQGVSYDQFVWTLESRSAPLTAPSGHAPTSGPRLLGLVPPPGSVRR